MEFLDAPPLPFYFSPEHEQFPNGEERPKHHLVASGQPKRQVDIRVVRAILCVATCQISYRATAIVHREGRALDQYHRLHPLLPGRPGNTSEVVQLLLGGKRTPSLRNVAKTATDRPFQPISPAYCQS